MRLKTSLTPFLNAVNLLRLASFVEGVRDLLSSLVSRPSSSSTARTESRREETARLMLEAESLRLIIYFQEILNQEGMHIKEADRWLQHAIAPKIKRPLLVRFSLNLLFTLFVLLPAVCMYVGVIVGMVVAMMISTVAWWTLTVTPSLMCVVMEVKVARDRRKLEEVAELSRKSDTEAVDIPIAGGL